MIKKQLPTMDSISQEHIAFEKIALAIQAELEKEGPRPYHRAHDVLIKVMLSALIEGLDSSLLMPLERALATQMREEKEWWQQQDPKIHTARGGLYTGD